MEFHHAILLMVVTMVSSKYHDDSPTTYITLYEDFPITNQYAECSYINFRITTCQPQIGQGHCDNYFPNKTGNPLPFANYLTICCAGKEKYVRGHSFVQYFANKTIKGLSTIGCDFRNTSSAEPSYFTLKNTDNVEIKDETNRGYVNISTNDHVTVDWMRNNIGSTDYEKDFHIFEDVYSISATDKEQVDKIGAFSFIDNSNNLQTVTYVKHNKK